MAINNLPFDLNKQGVIVNKIDSTANDSDKSWTVPAGKIWVLNWAHVALTSTATVGNRQMSVAIADDDGVDRMHLKAGAVQAASLTNHYGFLQGIYRETSFVANELQVPVPISMYALPGWTVRFFDEAAIDAAADDMTVSFQVLELDA